MNKNKYWIGSKYAFLRFCETDLKMYWTEEFASLNPKYNYSWDRAFRKALFDPLYEGKSKEYISDLRQFFGNYFPEIFEDIMDYDAK